jgi:hypothetical protein
LNPKDVEVTFLDPNTGEAKYDIKVGDPTLAEEIQKSLKNGDFVQNVNNAIGKNSENLPEKIRENLQIKDVNPDEEKTTESDEESETDSDKVNDFFL